MIGQLVAFYYVAAVYLTTFVMFFGICAYLVAILNEYNENLLSFEERIIKFTPSQGTWWSSSAARELKTTIFHLIQLHCDIYA